MNKLLGNLKYDLPASIVVFLVAVPLCLGIALGTGAEPIAGIIAGIVGGIVVGAISGSAQSVTGPAAGLISTVALILEKVPVFEALLVSICIAGLLQIVFGLLKTGFFINFVPVSVLKGMLAAIGILLILKQFPHLLGYDADFEGDEAFRQSDGNNTFSEIGHALGHITPLAIGIGMLGLAIQMFWDSSLFPLKRYKFLLPAPLVVVITGVGLNTIALNSFPEYAILGEHMVNLPEIQSGNDLWAMLRFPDLSYLGKGIIWISAIQIALIASIESLLSVEAADKLDEAKRITNPNRELIAQGTGNLVSGLLGGLPVTSVIVRSSVNINAGAKTKMSTITHGLILATSLLVFPHVLNSIPLCALASILIYTGYKLAKPSLFKELYNRGKAVFIPFVVTIVAILVSDLLIGIMVGIMIGIYFILKSNFHESVKVIKSDNNFLITFGQQVTFMNKVLLKKKLEEIPTDSKVYFDLSKCTFLDYDVIDILDDYQLYAHSEGISVDFKFANEKQKARLKLHETELAPILDSSQHNASGESLTNSGHRKTK